MKKQLYLIAFLIFISAASHAQCFCADIRFTVAAPDVKFKKDKANYSIEILTATSRGFDDTDRKERRFKKREVVGDTINLKFSTGGGIDTLIFVIKNVKTNEKMKITTLHMYSDILYFVDLTKFTTGSFLFNMRNTDRSPIHEIKPTDIEQYRE